MKISPQLIPLDYHPFGMRMYNRSSNSSSYRYSFNGKESDDEVKGEGNSLDFGARIYDPRIGKFLSMDAYSSKFPYYSPYIFAGNSPILAMDANGDSIKVYTQDISYFTTQLQNKLGDDFIVNATRIHSSDGIEQNGYFNIEIEQKSQSNDDQANATFLFLSTFVNSDIHLELAFEDYSTFSNVPVLIKKDRVLIEKYVRFKPGDSSKPSNWRKNQFSGYVLDKSVSLFNKKGLKLLDKNGSINGVDYILMSLATSNDLSKSMTGKILKSTEDIKITTDMVSAPYMEHKTTIKYSDEADKNRKVVIKDRGEKGIKVKSK